MYPASELEEYTGEPSFTVDGWDKESRISLRQAASSQSAWNHFIANSCHCTRGALQKDVDTCGMELAAAHIAMAANPALTRKTASLKKVILCS